MIPFQSASAQVEYERNEQVCSSELVVIVTDITPQEIGNICNSNSLPDILSIVSSCEGHMVSLEVFDLKLEALKKAHNPESIPRQH